MIIMITTKTMTDHVCYRLPRSIVHYLLACLPADLTSSQHDSSHGLRSLHGQSPLNPPPPQAPQPTAIKLTKPQVGLTDGQTPEEWKEEILLAREAGIDGFALNIGPSDPWTLPQLRAAYAAAEALPRHSEHPFVLFLSFDMAAGEWEVEQVAGLIREFRGSAAQCGVPRGRGGEVLPLVSTFEGPGWAGRWGEVRGCAGGDVFLVPDWSSLGPHGVGERLGVVDGAFSWAAWPRAGEHRVSAVEDGLYKGVLRGKAYMMGVSPWFYTSEWSLLGWFL